MHVIDSLLAQMTLEEKVGQLNLMTREKRSRGRSGGADDRRHSLGKDWRHLQSLGA